ncbi:hypothetical protein X962_1998 [Burkholderia pseudomallei MSHR7343]|nr:hypothetical protein X962_1998 [Burkholderia pseudomallei MSHR7343]
MMNFRRGDEERRMPACGRLISNVVNHYVYLVPRLLQLLSQWIRFSSSVHGFSTDRSNRPHSIDRLLIHGSNRGIRNASSVRQVFLRYRNFVTAIPMSFDLGHAFPQYRNRRVLA